MKNFFGAIAHFFERKLFATVLVVAILVYSFLQGTITDAPFLSSALLTFILYVFAQGTIDVNQLKVDIGSLHLSGDTSSSLQQDHGFLSRKFLASMVILIGLGFLGSFLKKFTNEWEYVGAIQLIYIIWIFAQGTLDISKMNLTTKNFSVLKEAPTQPAPLSQEQSDIVKQQLLDLKNSLAAAKDSTVVTTGSLPTDGVQQ